MNEQHLCAGCDRPIESAFVEFDLPAGMTFSQMEFYIFGKSQFCDECIHALESGDNVEYVR